MKLSIVTVVFNDLDYIEECVRSVLMQDYIDIEYIVIDGGSTDGTISIIKKYIDRITFFSSEPDEGIYDALNKGISIATGEVVGILHADDRFAENNIVSMVVDCFRKQDCDAVYGNVNFVKRHDPAKITRRWKSGPFTKTAIRYGWMPAHPTLYIKREVLKIHGPYSLNFKSCADYEMVLRLFFNNNIKTVFVDRLMVIMRNGGISNGSLKNFFTGLINDYRAIILNRVPYPLLVLVFKKTRKLIQFLR